MGRRILHISTGLELGGAEALLVEAATAAKKAGHDIAVAALKKGGGNRLPLERLGVEVFEIDASHQIPNPRAFVRLSHIISRVRPDIVQCWMYHANVFAQALLLMRHRGLASRLVWGIYNTEMDLARYSWRMRAVIRLGARWSGWPASIVYNAERARLDHERIGFHPRESVVIRNGVDTARFRPDEAARAAVRRELGLDEKAPVALIAARNDPQKDWPTVLAGAARAPGVVTIAAGLGADRLPAQPGLIRLGARTDMPALYAAADFFILPSAFGEGTSVAMSEAMSAGLPTIVTDVGDNARYAARAGFVVPTGDPESLAARIRELAADRPLREKLGAAARQVAVSEFDAGANYDVLHRLYDRLCAEAA